VTRILRFLPLLLFTAAPARPQATGFDPIVFELVKDHHIDFVTNSSRTAERHQPETMVAGVALFDYDNDGWTDLLVAGLRDLRSIPRGSSRAAGLG
jgi:hypothetical protein